MRKIQETDCAYRDRALEAIPGPDGRHGPDGGGRPGGIRACCVSILRGRAGLLLVRQPGRMRKPAAGNPAIDLGRNQCEQQHRGLRRPIQRQHRPVDQFQDQVTGVVLRDRHLPHGLLRRGRRTPDHQPYAEHRSLAESASLQHQHRDRPGRLRQLECVRELERADDGGVRRLLRAHLPDRRHQRREPDPVRGDRQLESLGHRVHDIRRDLAGLQRLGRLQPVHGQRHWQSLVL